MSGESKTHEHENCNIHGQGRINNHSHDHTHDHGHHHDHHHHHGSEAEMMGQDKFDSEEVTLAWTMCLHIYTYTDKEIHFFMSSH